VDVPPDAAEPPLAGVVAPELPPEEAALELPEEPVEADAGESVPEVVDVVDVVEVEVVAEFVVGALTAELVDVGTVNGGTSEVSSALELPPPHAATPAPSTNAAETAASFRARG
jgi:hypothetical protein